MKTRNLFTVWVSTAMLVTFATNATENTAPESDDQVVAGFERELNHETPSAAEVTRSDIGSDELCELVNKSLQTPEDTQATGEGE